MSNEIIFSISCSQQHKFIYIHTSQNKSNSKIHVTQSLMVSACSMSGNWKNTIIGIKK